MEERKLRKRELANSADENCDQIKEKLKQVDDKLASETAEENMKKVVENFSTFAKSDGSVHNNGMWSIKKKIFPKNAKIVPTAKKDFHGNIETNPENLKKLYLATYKHRLRHRPIRSDLNNLKCLKESLFELRLECVKLIKSKPWSKKQLHDVLRALKSNKSRDPHGLVREILKPGVIGCDLGNSLLTMMNKIKDKCLIPEFIKWANITSIYKGKGDRLDLTNERGIFIVTIFRGILMKLIYNEKYEVIDSNMSDSNVGARRNKNIRNHIFVINGIICDVLSSKNKKPIDIHIKDYRQCFDSMWLEETMNDLYEAGVTDDNLAVLYEANREVNVAVNTPNGLTVREKIKEIILQGDVFGPIECSVTVDSFGKECLAEDKYLYLYKDSVKIPILSMVDDALAVTECGYKSSMMNSYLNTKTNIKKLQYGTTKCFKMHVGKTCIPEVCPELFIDDWKIKEVNEVVTENYQYEEEHDGMSAMETVEHEKYLGDIISSDGKNSKNIAARKNRGIGVVNQVMSILEDICFGKYYFNVAMVLRNALLISSMLTNAEAWYGLSNADIAELEGVDEDLLRKVLECPLSTPKEMLYLELGVSPIRNMIRSRRLNFLQYILQQEKQSLLYTFLKAQIENPTKNDWFQTVEGDIDKFEIGLTIEEIENMSEESFKALVKKKEKEATLKYLNSEKISKNHTKVKHIKHDVLKMQDYLQPNTASIDESKFTFALRTRMIDIKCNYRGKHIGQDVLCPVCKEEEDTQQHLLVCDKLVDREALVTELPDYDHLFKDDLEAKLKMSRLLEKHFGKRKSLLKEKD